MLPVELKSMAIKSSTEHASGAVNARLKPLYTYTRDTQYMFPIEEKGTRHPYLTALIPKIINAPTSMALTKIINN